MDWDALDEKQAPEQLWHIADWLTEGPTLFAGSGGVGKSFVVQTLATALALQQSFLGPVRTQTKILLWMCEDAHDVIWKRQEAICRHFGVRLKDLRERLVLMPRRGFDNALMANVHGKPEWTPLRAELEEQIKDFGAHVLVIDNIAHVYGASEIERHPVTAFVNGIDGMVRSSILVGHVARSPGSEFAGSAAWENAVRMRWFLSIKPPGETHEEDAEPAPAEDTGVRYLSRRKTNYSIQGQAKLIWKGGLYVPDTGPTAGESFNAHYAPGRTTDEDAEAAVLAGVQRLAQIGQHGRASPTSPKDYLPKKLLAMKLDRGCSFRQLADALNRLLLAQPPRVQEVIVGKDGRHCRTKMGLVLA